eukprot:gene41503-51406_t
MRRAGQLSTRRNTLVIVTNGTKTQVIASHTGKPWMPETDTEQAFQNLVAAAACAATTDIRHAVATLMGTSSVWQIAVRHASAENIAALTGSWEESQCPFISDFLIPRNATGEVLNLLSEGKRLILLKGHPLVGKSNVLRHLSETTIASKRYAVLYLEAGVGWGIYQALADTLHRALEWPISAQEARSWLVQASKSEEVALVLAMDQLARNDSRSQRDIEDLSSSSFGNGLKVVVAADSSMSDQITNASNGRQRSAIGRRASVVNVMKLSFEELQSAASLLAQHHLLFMRGAQVNEYLTQPWLLRALAAPLEHIVRNRPRDNEGLKIPSVLTLDFFDGVRERFQSSELMQQFQSFARGVLRDAQKDDRSEELKLESLDTYVVRKSSLKGLLEHEEITSLIRDGYLQTAQHGSEGTAVLHS